MVLEKKCEDVTRNYDWRYNNCCYLILVRSGIAPATVPERQTGIDHRNPRILGPRGDNRKYRRPNDGTLETEMILG